MMNHVPIRLLTVGLLLLGIASEKVQAFDLTSGTPTLREVPGLNSGEDFKRSSSLKFNQRSLSSVTKRITRNRKIPNIRLNLFPDIQYTIVTSEARKDKGKKFLWKGRIKGIKGSRSFFIIHNNRLSGTIRMPGKVFVIGSGDDNIPIVVEYNTAEFPPDEPPGFEQEKIQELEQRRKVEGEGFRESSLSRKRAVSTKVLSNRTLRRLETQKRGSIQALDNIPGKFVAKGYECDASQKIVDVMVVYTDNTADYFDSFGLDVESQIELAIAEANDAYEASGIKHRLNLVHTVGTDYSESSLEADRNALRKKSDNNMDWIHTVRDQYDADLVALWGYRAGSPDGYDYCGIAYIMKNVSDSFEDYGFSSTKASCAISNYSFAHEMGHNMGARHDRYVDNKQNSPYKYNHGYTKHSDNWRTIMAYSDKCTDKGTSCTRLGYWSNPDNKYSSASGLNPSSGGFSMGVSGTSSAASTLTSDGGGADNHRALNNTLPTVATFRNKLGKNEKNDEFGTSLAAGDFNGDGYLDLAVGAPGETPGSGEKSGWVFVYKGTPCGLDRWHTLGQSSGSLSGSNEKNDEFGTSLAAGDFNGDGKDDLAVGAPGESPGSGKKSGWVFVYKGSSSGLSGWKGLGQKDGSLSGSNEKNDEYGTSLAAGDFNGDGKDDLAVGAPGESPGSDPKSGFIFVYNGKSSGPSAWQGLDQED